MRELSTSCGVIGPPPRSGVRRWLPIIAIGLRLAQETRRRSNLSEVLFRGAVLVKVTQYGNRERGRCAADGEGSLVLATR